MLCTQMLRRVFVTLGSERTFYAKDSPEMDGVTYSAAFNIMGCFFPTTYFSFSFAFLRLNIIEESIPISIFVCKSLFQWNARAAPGWVPSSTAGGLARLIPESSAPQQVEE